MLLTPAIIQLCLCACSIDFPLQFSPCLSSRAYPASTKTHPPPAAGYTFHLVPSRSSPWLPTVSIPAVCLSKPTDPQPSYRDSFDSKSSGAFSSPRSSETWDQYPGGSIASSMLAPLIKQSCHCRGWEAGEIKHYWCINEAFFLVNNSSICEIWRIFWSIMHIKASFPQSSGIGYYPPIIQ